MYLPVRDFTRNCNSRLISVSATLVVSWCCTFCLNRSAGWWTGSSSSRRQRTARASARAWSAAARSWLGSCEPARSNSARRTPVAGAAGTAEKPGQVRTCQPGAHHPFLQKATERRLRVGRIRGHQVGRRYAELGHDRVRDRRQPREAAVLQQGHHFEANSGPASQLLSGPAVRPPSLGDLAGQPGSTGSPIAASASSTGMSSASMRFFSVDGSGLDVPASAECTVARDGPVRRMKPSTDSPRSASRASTSRRSGVDRPRTAGRTCPPRAAAARTAVTSAPTAAARSAYRATGNAAEPLR
jgi:hypothetical protein